MRQRERERERERGHVIIAGARVNFGGTEEEV